MRRHPDGALEVFVSAFQRAHFELDEAVCDQGFDVWADVAAESLPLLMRGTDRCNGIDPLGGRPGYALQWALIQDVFNGDQRSEVIAELAEAFGEALARRLEAAEPPGHGVHVDHNAEKFVPEATSILARLRDARFAEDVENIVQQELRRWYGRRRLSRQDPQPRSRHYCYLLCLEPVFGPVSSLVGHS